VKPQNILVTRNERSRAGQYSEVSVTAFDMAPPRPWPVTKRSAMYQPNDGYASPVADDYKSSTTPV